MESKIVSIDLGERSYDVYIGKGLIYRLSELMPEDLERRSVYIITDTNVASYARAVSDALSDHAARVLTCTLPPGEQTKSFNQLEHICGWLLDNRVNRNAVIVAVGGGVIGDLAGFAAAIIMRGIEFVQIPTSLLAQVDSSVGGKTGINAPQGKNLIGSFHQPSAVIADLETLTTLPRRELLAGYAEIVKYGLIEQTPFFEWLEQHGESVVNLDAGPLAHAIATSIKAKATIVESDELETSGRRAVLNFGHTFGHALEAAAGYDGRLLHGEAVAIGMCMAMDLSARMNLCSHADAQRVIAHLGRVGLPTRAADIVPTLPVSADSLVETMRLDKKALDGAMRFIVSHGIGRTELRGDIPPELVMAVVRDSLGSI